MITTIQKRYIVFPLVLAAMLSFISGCGSNKSAPAPTTGSTSTAAPCSYTPAASPTAPTGTYSASASEGMYTHLLTNTAVRRPSVAGALQLITSNCMVTLVDSRGVPIQLRGMSTHGLQWYPQIINNNAFVAFHTDWDANVMRLAMYVAEGGYATDPTVEQTVINGIKFAIANDMYVIVDWHVETPGDPNASVYNGALGFFTDISKKFPNDSHIIYELANEPNGNTPGVTNDAAGWANVKSYAQPIIQMLRTTGNKNIVVVGTPNWSQRPDLAALDPINDSATLYTVHFYAGTHLPSNDDKDRTNVMSNARFALEHGVGIFVTEWGTSDASGNNGPYFQAADTWLDFLNSNNISWANWAADNKNETSAAFIPYVSGVSTATSLDPGLGLAWPINQLSLSGEYVRTRMQGVAYQPIDRTAFSSVISDFNDGTLQGWGINAGSPVTTVTLSNVNNAMLLTGMSATSTDVTATGYWNNVRISDDGLSPGSDPNLFGAKAMSIDVIVPAPTTVSIAALPQSSTHSWANPTQADQITPSHFVLQSNGTYKATLTIPVADSPNFQTIAQDTTLAGSTMTNLILFVGAASGGTVTLDNITVTGNRTVTAPVVNNSPAGQVTFPSDFEDKTRQGWAWDPASGVQSALTVAPANSSQALAWDVTYPTVKPTDNWADAPRLLLGTTTLTRDTNNFLLFDFYLKPTRATTGSLSLNLAFQPPSLGYWAQVATPVTIPLSSLSTMTKTSDGLYHIQASFNLTQPTATSQTITPSTALGSITIIVQDTNSDFSGTMYIDNVRLSPTSP